MKLIFKFAVIILVNLFINSCIQEQRVYPKQPAQSSTSTSSNSSSSNSSSSNNSSSNSNNSSSNTSNTSRINYVNSVSYSYSETVDSNNNQYFSSFRLNLNFKTNIGSKIKYGIYASTSSSSYYSTYALIYQSPLIDNYKNDIIYYSRNLKADSILNLSNISSSMYSTGQSGIYLFLVVQDSANNNYTYQQSTTYYPSYASSVNYIPIYNSSYAQMETVQKDLSFTLYNYSSNSFGVTNGVDINKNGYIQSPLQFKSYFYTNASNKFAYYKIYYSTTSSSNYLLYGTTSSISIPTSYTYNSPAVISISAPLVTLTSNSYYFKIEAYDTKTNALLRSDYSSNYSNIESATDDQRTFLLGYVKFIVNEDNDKDGYPSTYYLKLKINSSDNIFPSSSTLNVTIANYGSTYYQNILTRSNLTYSDTLSLLISGGTGYSKSYYDFGLNLISNYTSLLNVDASKNSNFTQIKLEKTTED